MKQTAREKMQKWREKRGLSYADISQRCGVSAGLISCIEGGWVTHPNIVSKLQKVYKLTDLQSEELLPEHRRPHGNDYEPDRYVEKVDTSTDRILPKQSLIDRYCTERHNVQIKRHEKRSAY